MLSSKNHRSSRGFDSIISSLNTHFSSKLPMMMILFLFVTLFVILLERQRGEERRVKERSKMPTKVWLKERYKLLFFLQRKKMKF
jgi:hypothetical protein